MNVIFKDWKCTINFAKYSNGRTAIQLFDVDDGQPIATASVNLVDEPMAADEVAIKDYSENEGMFNVLNQAGLISDPVRFTSSGFIRDIPICKLLRKAHAETT
jgi:hypothetical protein